MEPLRCKQCCCASCSLSCNAKCGIQCMKKISSNVCIQSFRSLWQLDNANTAAVCIMQSVLQHKVLYMVHQQYINQCLVAVKHSSKIFPFRELASAMKGADAVICAIGSSGFNPKGPQTVDYEVSAFQPETSSVVCTCNNSQPIWCSCTILCEGKWRLFHSRQQGLIPHCSYVGVFTFLVLVQVLPETQCLLTSCEVDAALYPRTESVQGRAEATYACFA